MPHIQIDYSKNVEDRIDVGDLCRALAQAAGQTGVFPKAGIRVRATSCDHYFIADGNPDHAFMDISVRLRGGRTDVTKQDATKAIFAAAEAFCSEMMNTTSLMLSLEMRDIDPDLSPKASSIRKYLPKEMQ